MGNESGGLMDGEGGILRSENSCKLREPEEIEDSSKLEGAVCKTVQPSNNSPETVEISTTEPLYQRVRRGRMIQRGYTLNETASLKKKLQHENRKVNCEIKEAKDGSSVTVTMRSSFFDCFKS